LAQFENAKYLVNPSKSSNCPLTKFSAPKRITISGC